MSDILGLVTIGISAFIATNIDDIFILMLFFAPYSSSLSSTIPARQVIVGQYLGIGLLVGISALGSFLPLVVPQYVIGLLGIAPIAIGVKKLIYVLRKEDERDASKDTG